MRGLTLNLDTVHLSDEQFYQLCQNNRDLNFERTAREYMNAGVQLGWLINPQQQQVEIYRQGIDVEVRNLPTELSGENVLPGFNLDLSLYAL